jgi:hypothetical protein
MKPAYFSLNIGLLFLYLFRIRIRVRIRIRIRNPDPKPDPKCLFRFRIGSGSGQKFRILTDPVPVPDPAPQHCQKHGKKFYSCKFFTVFGHPNHGFGSAIRKNAGSGSAFLNQCGPHKPDLEAAHKEGELLDRVDVDCVGLVPGGQVALAQLLLARRVRHLHLQLLALRRLACQALAGKKKSPSRNYSIVEAQFNCIYL